MNEAETMELAKWAEVGARTRLKELDEEKARIYQVFPALEPRAMGSLGPAPTPPPDSGNGHKPHRTMPTAERKRVSKRMKAYWKARRAAG